MSVSSRVRPKRLAKMVGRHWLSWHKKVCVVCGTPGTAADCAGIALAAEGQDGWMPKNSTSTSSATGARTCTCRCSLAASACKLPVWRMGQLERRAEAISGEFNSLWAFATMA
jgi:hypothetical protein